MSMCSKKSADMFKEKISLSGRDFPISPFFKFLKTKKTKILSRGATSPFPHFLISQNKKKQMSLSTPLRDRSRKDDSESCGMISIGIKYDRFVPKEWKFSPCSKKIPSGTIPGSPIARPPLPHARLSFNPELAHSPILQPAHFKFFQNKNA